MCQSQIIPSSIKVLQLLPDDSFIYVLGQSKNKFNVISFDEETFRPYTHFDMKISYRDQYRSGIDENCVYIPTTYGYVLVVDKLSGEILESFDTGWGVICSPVIVSDTDVSCLCGYPISNGWDINTSQYSICVFDKENGKRVARSKFVKQTPIKYASDDSGRYLVSGLNIEQYNEQCRFMRKATMITYCSQDVILTDNFIVCSCEDGLVSFLRKSDLALYNAVFVGKGILPPVKYIDDDLLTVHDNTVLKISPYSSSPEYFSDLPTDTTHFVTNQSFMYSINKLGELCQSAL